MAAMLLGGVGHACGLRKPATAARHHCSGLRALQIRASAAAVPPHAADSVPRSLIRASAASGSDVKHSLDKAASKADSAVPAATPAFKWGADMKSLGICVGIATLLWFLPAPSGVSTQVLPSCACLQA